jgi:hypothetical protein
VTDPIQDFLDAPPAREIDQVRARQYKRLVEEADSGSLSEDEERERAEWPC